MATTNLCVEVWWRIVIKMRLAKVSAPSIPQIYCYLLNNMDVKTDAKREPNLIRTQRSVSLLLMFPSLVKVSWGQRPHVVGLFVTESQVFSSNHTLHWL